MEDTKSDTVVVCDRSSRRRFIRNGSAFLLAGAAVATSPSAFADCDGQQNQVKKCSDSDTGSGSDEAGCGQCGRTDNVPARFEYPESKQSVAVKKIKA